MGQLLELTVLLPKEINTLELFLATITSFICLADMAFGQQNLF
jgi:hypothetical protein